MRSTREDLAKVAAFYAGENLAEVVPTSAGMPYYTTI
jgi:hypothetical protein